MPRGTASSLAFRGRFTAVAAVFGGHLALFVLLTSSGDRDASEPESDRMTLVFIDLPDEHPDDAPERATRPAARSNRMPQSASAETRAIESTAITQPQVDWDASARGAAARAAAAPEVRDFGFPRREPEPVEKKEFGWDKVHTERVSALAGGGMLIRLSDNCSIVLMPLPLGGCLLGKRKARGDLFEEMDAPVELGDWK
jgi:hypothetical protein